METSSLFDIATVIVGVPVIGLSLLTVVKIANAMGLTSVFGTKTTGQVAT